VTTTPLTLAALDASGNSRVLTFGVERRSNDSSDTIGCGAVYSTYQLPVPIGCRTSVE
jgi:hypothetical protein